MVAPTVVGLAGLGRRSYADAGSPTESWNMVSTGSAPGPTEESADDALPGLQGIDRDGVEEVGDAAEILAQGVAVSTRMQADAAGALEAGTATSARAIEHGAEVVQATAHDHAYDAAQLALHAVEALVEALGAAADSSLTPEQAILVIAKASEASAQLAKAAKASGAFTTAATAAGLATQAADYTAGFELHMIATAVAASKLAETAADP